MNIVTSEVMDDERIVSDITCVATKGKEVVEDFLCSKKDDVKKVVLRTFPSERKTQKVNGVPKTDLLSSEVTALKRIITAQLSYGEEKEKAVAKILTKEILPFPPFIFEHLPQQSTKHSATNILWLKNEGGEQSCAVELDKIKRRTFSLAGHFEIQRNSISYSTHH